MGSSVFLPINLLVGVNIILVCGIGGILPTKTDVGLHYGTRSVLTTVTQATPIQYPPSPNSPLSPVQLDAQYTADHPHGLGR